MQVKQSDISRLLVLCSNASHSLNEMRNLMRDIDFATGCEFFDRVEYMLIAETLPNLIDAFGTSVTERQYDLTQKETEK